MFNIFNIFKKKNKQEIEQPSEAASDVQEEVVLSDNIVIHTMPEHFRSEHIKADQAQKTGIIIISVGIVFLIIIFVLFYYFFFIRQPKKSIQAPISASTSVIEPIAPAEKEQLKQLDETIATTSITLPMPNEESLSTSTETSTLDEINMNQPLDLSAGIDSDNDGLTDEEEKIFKTNSDSADTDNDGYSDLTEILNNYNPAGAGFLAANPNLIIYNNKTYNYNLLYPKAWSKFSDNGDDSVMFKAIDNSFIQVIAQNNNEQKSIDDWYKQQFNINSIDQKNIIDNNNWKGIINSDGLTVYLMDIGNKYIFTIAYNPAASNTLNYLNLFQAMIKSFKIIE